MTVTRAEVLRQTGARLRRDERRWQRAKSYSDLLRLNVLFLQGKVACHPQGVIDAKFLLRHKTMLHKETACIVHDLVSLNKLGFFTDCSQPGCYTRTRAYAFEQRAFVSGWVPKALARRIVRISDRSRDLVAVREREVSPEHIVVSRQGIPGGVFRPHTWIGRVVIDIGTMRARGRVGLPALQELGRRCVPLAIYDRRWGRNTHLWSILLSTIMDSG